MTKKIGVFTRVSTEAEGNSLAFQLQIAEDHANKLNEEIAKVYEEVGMSASIEELGESPAMQELIEDIKNGEINYLIAYRRDRLFRNSKDYLEFVSLLEENNVELYLTASNESHTNAFGGIVNFMNSLKMV